MTGYYPGAGLNRSFMKHQIIVLVITQALLLSTACESQREVEIKQPSNSLDDLEIVSGGYPRAIFFRNAERAAAYLPYHTWEHDFGQLMGIEGKALDEEKPGSATWRNAYYFSRFKKEHPEQMVLLHYNGMGRMPQHKPVEDRFFAGHWLYYEGVTILSDIPSDELISEIRVSDASQFFMDIGLRVTGFNDEIGLCDLNDDGTPNWHRSEHVKLLDVDYENNIITVKRACFGTDPMEFKASDSYAAVHCVSGPWGDTQLWAYNLSTTCPRDKDGRTCSDVLSDDLAFRFSSSGELAAFDGLEFDSFNWVPQILKNPRGESPRGTKGVNRAIDVNADGKGDDGIVEDVQVFGLGVNHFVRQLREKLGDERVIMGDGTHHFTQRAFGLLNGIESEGWPTGEDPEFNEWSDGLNRMQFWNSNSFSPVLSYINFRYWGQVSPDQIGPRQVRVVIAASTLMNTLIAQFDPVEKFYSKKIPERSLAYNELDKYPGMLVFDELVMGQEKKKGWLGQPVSGTIELARKAPAVMLARGGEGLRALAARIEGPVDARVEDGKLIVSSTDPSASNLLFSLPGLDIPGKYLTLFIDASCDKMGPYPGEIARLFWVEIPEEKDEHKRHMGWANKNPFESVFCFRDIRAGRTTLHFEMDGTEDLVIHGFEAYAGGDLRCREFENGVVLVNPTREEATFELAGLFPGQKFRRFAGTSEQDPVTNNGEAVVTPTISIPGLDALFLVKD